MNVRNPVWSITLSSCFLSAALQASTVAVIDSGLDIQHPQLQNQIWLNPNDSTEDRTDNDNDGYVDDLHGWNFVNNNAELIDYKYTKLYNDDMFHFFDLQGKALKGEAQSSDQEWLKAKMGDGAFLKNLQTFGNFVHGTHVSGIVLAGHPDAKVLGIKLVPTENPLASVEEEVREAASRGKSLNWIVKQIVKGGLSTLAKAQGQIFGQVGKYIGSQDVDVANASLGMGKTQAEFLVRPVLKLAAVGKDPSPELLKEMVVFLLKKVNAEQEILLKSSPKTLFVFAAGNEASDNSEYPTAPASIDSPQRLSVAATFADGRLASFSNFGGNVDVAAPGVAIESSIPDNRQLFLSGTSQAAPYVAGVAAAIKDANPELDAAQIKSIIMSTVDAVDSLKGKVASGGVVNSKRAVTAAAYSVEHSVGDAIRMAQTSVASSLDTPNLTRQSLWFDPMALRF